MQCQKIYCREKASSPEQLAEEFLELFPKDAVYDEVDGGVEGDEEVRHLGQLGDLNGQHLKGENSNNFTINVTIWNSYQ